MLAAEVGVLLSFCQLLIDVSKQYNGVSMKNKTKEEAYLEMLKPAETIMFKVQNCVDELPAIKESRGDGFYIRYVNHSCLIHHSLTLVNKVRTGKRRVYRSSH